MLKEKCYDKRDVYFILVSYDDVYRVGVIILRVSALALCTDHFTLQSVLWSFVYILQ